MNTPSIHVPHVTLPDVPHVDVAEVTDRAGDVWAVGLEKVQDLATAAFDRAGDLAAAAADRFDDLPERAIGLAGVAIPALRSTPKRSKKPYLLVALVLAVVVGGVWFRRRRASSGVGSTYDSPADVNTPPVSAVS